ncbi:MAG: PAS domain-containing protein [Ginsengibacter sp.]
MQIKEVIPEFLSGGGKMGQLIRAHDWSENPLGNPSGWPQTLRIATRIMLDSPFAMYIAWGREYIQLYNDGYRPILGTTKHPRALGISTRETFEEIWPTIGPMFEGVMQGTPVGFPDFILHLDRNGFIEECVFDFSYSPIRLENGEVGGVLVTVIETTEKVNSIKQLKESEQRFRSLIQEAAVATCMFTGPAMVIEIANKTMLDYWGKDEKVLGKPLKEALPELEGQPFLEILNAVYTTGKTYEAREAEAKLIISGVLTTSYFDFTHKALRNSDGEIIGVINTAVDVTQKVLAQRKREKSEANLRNVILQAPVAMCILKEPSHIVEIANERMFELWGKKGEDVLGKPIFEGLTEAKGQGFEQLLDSVFITGETFKASELPITLPRKGGIETVYVNFVYEAFRNEDGRISGVMAVAVEVTEQMEARHKLQDSEERLRIAVESGELGTFELDYSSPNVLITSAQFDIIFGFDHQAARRDYALSIHPDDLPIRKKAHEESLSTGKLFYEVRILKENKKINWIRVVGRVIYDKTGKAQKLLGILQDITEQKNIQQQKDNFIAMASHELKTPLTSIKVLTQLVENILLQKGNTAEAGMLNRMNSQIDRLTNLISDLLNITRINSGELAFHKTYFNFNLLVREMIEELQRSITNHSLVLNLGPAVTVFADKERIGQVITNFISNAIKYSPDASHVNVTTNIVANEVIFCVQDFGIGISTESHEKIFEQFYRVNNIQHQSFPGLGLGLHISSEIIKREGGRIWVTSIEGQGSQFYFSLMHKN